MFTFRMHKKLLFFCTILSTLSAHAQQPPKKQSQNPIHIIADVALSQERIEKLERRIVQQQQVIASLQTISQQQSELIKQLSEPKQQAQIKAAYH